MIRIGILGTANIAERRMIPAILENPHFVYQGVAIATRNEVEYKGTESEFAPVYERKLEKADHFRETFGGTIFEGYEELLKRDDVDAVYIPLPPALHAKWAEMALEYGKHVLLEKPFTVSFEETEKLIRLAREKGLAMIENYGFCYHAQMQLIRNEIAEGAIGELRLIRASFGFPKRASDDFRYSRELGGGALLDCGGYTIKAALAFLKGPVELAGFSPMRITEFDVDISGSGILRDSTSLTAQFAYGMDNAYKCELELWGSKGYISAPRIFTAPKGFEAPVRIQSGDDNCTKVAQDDQFSRILDRFSECVDHGEEREKCYEEILTQGAVVEKVMKHIIQ